MTSTTHPTTSTIPRRIAVLLLVAALAVLPTACGDDDTDTDAADAPAADQGPPGTDDADDPTDEPAEGAQVVDVTAVDFAFEGLPATIEAGTRLTLANDAPHELHELVAFRLPDEETRPVGDLLQLPEAELGAVLGAGPPQTVLLAPPGAEQIPAVGDGTLTEPGRYLVMCAIPTGVDPAEYLAAAAASGGEQPQVDGGPPHFVSGMFAELTVE